MEERPPSPHDPPGPDPVEPPPSLDPHPAFEVGTGSTLPPPVEEPPIPWEQEGLDFFSAFYETLRLVFLKPRTAFRRVPVAPSFAKPLGFAILVGWPGILAATLWDLAFSRYLQSILPLASDQQWDRSPSLEIGFALATPIWLPVALFLAALLQHLFLMMVGAGRRGFVGTFRVLCYAQAASLLGLLPLFGGLLSLLWHVVLQVIGLAAVHRVSVGRVLFAVILPITLCCACVILMAIFGAAWLAWLRNG